MPRAVLDGDTHIIRSDRHGEEALSNIRIHRRQGSRGRLHTPWTPVLDHLRAAGATRRKTEILRWSHARPRDAGRLTGRKSTPSPDAEITAAVADDPDAVPFDLDWSQAVLVVPGRERRRSRSAVDEDVLDFFKNQGAGYQRRYERAVLRSYMEQTSGTKARKRR